MDKTRQNAMTLNPISYQEINAFSDAMGYNITSFETRAIREIDKAYLIFINTKKGKSE